MWARCWWCASRTAARTCRSRRRTASPRPRRTAQWTRRSSRRKSSTRPRCSARSARSSYSCSIRRTSSSRRASQRRSPQRRRASTTTSPRPPRAPSPPSPRRPSPTCAPEQLSAPHRRAHAIEGAHWGRGGGENGAVAWRGVCDRAGAGGRRQSTTATAAAYTSHVAMRRLCDGRGARDGLKGRTLGSGHIPFPMADDEVRTGVSRRQYGRSSARHGESLG
mmetsp:Transcript_993/g.2740  ORF Transcript_993/g.2740 Transcript_993/m.2740 type:complete len:221 (-) Transcript_993:214-876(-)